MSFSIDDEKLLRKYKTVGTKNETYKILTKCFTSL